MPTCEKCWLDAARIAGPHGNHAQEYRDILARRDAEGRECTPEEQAGPNAGICPDCQRATVHQHAGVCMNCGKRP